jgi:hypothetical protein
MDMRERVVTTLTCIGGIMLLIMAGRLIMEIIIWKT